jgi:ABC-type polysaccharide/polyol phosphate transport system ATPase subunit
MSEREPLVSATDVWLKFPIHYRRPDVTLRDVVAGWFARPHHEQDVDRTFWALRGISLVARPGQVVGVIGVNGAGKTTLLKVLGAICAPDRGAVHARGKVSCLLAFGVGFSSSLSGRENIYLSGSILGMKRREIDACVEEVIAFSELGDFINAPVQTYSAGMRGRLGFAIAAHLQPDILLLDEVLSTGDAGFQAKAGSLINRLRSERRIIFISSHSMPLIESVCTDVLWLENGTIRMRGTPDAVTSAYITEQRRLRAGTTSQAGTRQAGDREEVEAVAAGAG